MSLQRIIKSKVANFAYSSIGNHIITIVGGGKMVCGMESLLC